MPQEAELPLKLRAAFTSHQRQRNKPARSVQEAFPEIGLWLLVDEMPDYPGPLRGEGAIVQDMFGFTDDKSF